MGHPIDPGDPRNGGCNTCIPYVPDILRVIYVLLGDDIYRGLIDRDPFAPSVWRGELTGDHGGFKQFILGLCQFPTNTAIIHLFGRQQFFLADAHCDIPFTGYTQQGDLYFIREPRF